LQADDNSSATIDVVVETAKFSAQEDVAEQVIVIETFPQQAAAVHAVLLPPTEAKE
jgi:hypothetical protein